MFQGVTKTDEAKNADTNELMEKLSATDDGLSTSEAKERLEEYGPNEISERKVSPVLKFLSYFWGPIPIMIEVAAILSAIIRHWEDFGIIFALLLINSVVAFWQEHKADNAVELLKKKLSPVARVRRDGEWQKIEARELVPGDVVRVRLGDIVPADIKLIDGDYLQVDESALTGESLPVDKEVADVTYAGSIIRQGEMNGLVVNTGMNTYFGKTTKLVEEAKTKSHFQKAIIKIGDYLIATAIILVVGIFLVSIFRHEGILATLQFALVLTVAAIPAAVPAVLSVTMTIGAIALSKKQAIVSKLVSIEEMAGMDTLCSDKTGTITKNELTVGEVKAFGDYSDQDVIALGSLASREEDQDPIDNAIIAKAKEQKETKGTVKVVDFMPFDPVSKRTEATIEQSGSKSFKVSKGAPQVVLSLAANKDDISGEVDEVVDSFAQNGYRALGVARTNEQGKWQFTGLIALYDPPREDSAETIVTAESMGVNVKMVTGDHAAIAKEIAKQVKLPTSIIPAESFLDKSNREAQRVVESADGFAQVFPEHKYHIVELLQDKDHIVGMTGDGVNDAPALKKADVGIAVDGATDAAKSSADIVLTQPGLSVIIDAIRESRKIFQRMTNYSIYRISETIRVLLFITTSIVVFKFYPVTPLMIVLLAILNDLPIMTIAYDNVRFSSKPERWNMRILLGIASLLGFVGVLQTFGLLYVGLHVFHLSHEILQSFIYLKLSVAGHLLMFMARTRGHFWSIRPAKSLLIAVIATQLVATLIVVYGILLPAMGWKLAGFVWAYSLAGFVIIDYAKISFYKLLDHTDLRFSR